MLRVEAVELQESRIDRLVYTIEAILIASGTTVEMKRRGLD